MLGRDAVLCRVLEQAIAHVVPPRLGDAVRVQRPKGNRAHLPLVRSWQVAVLDVDPASRRLVGLGDEPHPCRAVLGLVERRQRKVWAEDRHTPARIAIDAQLDGCPPVPPLDERAGLPRVRGGRAVRPGQLVTVDVLGVERFLRPAKHADRPQTVRRCLYVTVHVVPLDRRCERRVEQVRRVAARAAEECLRVVHATDEVREVHCRDLHRIVDEQGHRVSHSICKHPVGVDSPCPVEGVLCEGGSRRSAQSDDLAAHQPRQLDLHHNKAHRTLHLAAEHDAGVAVGVGRPGLHLQPSFQHPAFIVRHEGRPVPSQMVLPPATIGRGLHRDHLSALMRACEGRTGLSRPAHLRGREQARMAHLWQVYKAPPASGVGREALAHQQWPNGHGALGVVQLQVETATTRAGRVEMELGPKVEDGVRREEGLHPSVAIAQLGAWVCRGGLEQQLLRGGENLSRAEGSRGPPLLATCGWVVLGQVRHLSVVDNRVPLNEHLIGHHAVAHEGPRSSGRCLPAQGAPEHLPDDFLLQPQGCLARRRQWRHVAIEGGHHPPRLAGDAQLGDVLFGVKIEAVGERLLAGSGLEDHLGELVAVEVPRCREGRGELHRRRAVALGHHGGGREHPLLRALQPLEP